MHENEVNKFKLCFSLTYKMRCSFVFFPRIFIIFQALLYLNMEKKKTKIADSSAGCFDAFLKRNAIFCSILITEFYH